MLQGKGQKGGDARPWIVELLLLLLLVTSVVSNSVQPHELQLPGSSVHEIFQARVLEWVAIAFSS